MRACRMIMKIHDEQQTKRKMKVASPCFIFLAVLPVTSGFFLPQLLSALILVNCLVDAVAHGGGGGSEYQKPAQETSLHPSVRTAVKLRGSGDDSDNRSAFEKELSSFDPYSTRVIIENSSMTWMRDRPQNKKKMALSSPTRRHIRQGPRRDRKLSIGWESARPDDSSMLIPSPSSLPLLLGDWELCSTSDQCINGCCSLENSDNGSKLQCIPLVGGFISSICRKSSDTNDSATLPLYSSTMPSSDPMVVLSAKSRSLTGTCGNGTVGDGVCNDGTCCSHDGFCGKTPAHEGCDSTSSPTPLPTCGDGDIGNGMCPNGLCCSSAGWCETKKDYCGESTIPPTVTTDSSLPSNTSVVVGCIALALIVVAICCYHLHINGQTEAVGNSSAAFPIPSRFFGSTARTLELDEFSNPRLPQGIPSESRPGISQGHIEMATSTSSDTFRGLYEQIRMLGQGAQGQVFECRKITKNPGETEFQATYAVKRVDTTMSNKKSMEYLQNEINVVRSLGRNNHTVELHDVVRDWSYTYMVMGLLSGGDVNEWIRKNRLLSEADAQKLCKGLFEAIQFCHQKKIAHRDIKPANLLLSDMGNLASVKLADFGLAKEVPKLGLTTRCGTPCYMPPEVILSGTPPVLGYGKQCDMWSVGVVVYELLVGEHLFLPAKIKDMYRKIVNFEVPFNDSNPKWTKTSEHAKILIQNLVKKNPQSRWSAQQAVESEWINAERMDSIILDISSVEEHSVHEQRFIDFFFPTYRVDTKEDEFSWNYSAHTFGGACDSK